jgi:hypothetical protein
MFNKSKVLILLSFFFLAGFAFWTVSAQPLEFQSPEADAVIPKRAGSEPGEVSGAIAPSAVGSKTTTPSVEFLSPRNGAKISQEIEIEIRVEEATEIIFYAKRGGSLTPVYLGQGQLKDNNRWKFSWDTRQFPNGTHFLFAEISNQYGSYQSPEIKIIVQNQVEKTEESKTKEQELRETKEQAEKIEQEVKREVKETENQANQQAEKIIKIVQEAGAISSEEVKEQKPQIEEKIGQEIKEIANAIREEQQKTEELSKSLEAKKQVEQKLQKKQAELEKIEQTQASEFIKDTVEEIKQEKKEVIKQTEKLLEEIEEDIKIKEGQKQVAQSAQKINKQNLAIAIEEIVERVPAHEQAREVVNQAAQIMEQNLTAMEQRVRSQEKVKAELEKIMWLDSDSDGLPDILELEFNTDPFNPDTSGDGYLDGIVVALDLDPSMPITPEKVIFQDPRKVQPKRSDEFFVERAEIVFSEITQRQVLKIEGRGLPNTFINIYLFSLPTIITTRTDAYGRWVHELDKSLESGKHEIYIVLADHTGEITARSESFAFVKSGASILRLIPEVWAQETDRGMEEIAPPHKMLRNSFFVLTISVIVLAISVAIVVVGFFTKRREKKEIFSQD